MFTGCSLLPYTHDMITLAMNMQRRLIRKLMLYEFKTSPNPNPQGQLKYLNMKAKLITEL